MTVSDADATAAKIREAGGTVVAEPIGLPADVPSHWQVYLAVPDADAAAETTRSAGGRVPLGPVPTPRGKLAILADPQGAVFGIVEPHYPEPR